MQVGRVLLRVTVGSLFIGHGTQKLFGWFGGGGLEATSQGFESLGLRPGRANAIAAGTAEAGGGALLVAGLATPFAASVLTGTMLVATKRVHLKNGPWVSKGGYEYNLVLAAAALALAEVGPGSPSLDGALGRERSGAWWALAALAAGALGAAAVDRAADRHPAPSPAAALHEEHSAEDASPSAEESSSTEETSEPSA